MYTYVYLYMDKRPFTHTSAYENILHYCSVKYTQIHHYLIYRLTTNRFDLSLRDQRRLKDLLSPELFGLPFLSLSSCFTFDLKPRSTKCHIGK